MCVLHIFYGLDVPFVQISGHLTMSCDCIGVCILEGSSDVKGTVYFEQVVRDGDLGS